jgi:hypothetical protein
MPIVTIHAITKPATIFVPGNIPKTIPNAVNKIEFGRLPPPNQL